MIILDVADSGMCERLNQRSGVGQYSHDVQTEQVDVRLDVWEAQVQGVLALCLPPCPCPCTRSPSFDACATHPRPSRRRPHG